LRSASSRSASSPLILPPVITAVALYIFFARIGLLGTIPGLIVAHTILTVPSVVLLMSVAIRQFDVDVSKRAAAGPAAERARRPAFIISFDEVIVTIFLAGAYATIPKRMFNELILQAIATLLIALSVITICIVAWLMRRAGVLGRTLGEAPKFKRSG
jgi:putative spermidine/putrescine transport system permease protein